MNQEDQSQLTRPWVDWTARQIHDPVWRLRYLQSVIPAPVRPSRWKSRKTIGLLTLLAIGTVAAPLSLRMSDAAPTTPAPKPPVIPPPRPKPLVATVDPPFTDVWPVETTSGYEVYSNGLRIENQYAVSHRPRAYLAYPATDPEGTRGEMRTTPAGIVYHTTESLQAPFEPSQNNVLKRVGESLISYVRRRRCYHFLIDRFGRVFRIVNERDAADHAGHSVWADDRYVYVNLNDSFIGISFEAQTGFGEDATSAGDAQVRSAAILTEMLRSRYKIPARNCVTHAQVSVNPSNMQIGYHIDWASSFPFEKLGLPDNYAWPSPAVSTFGFGFDVGFEQRAGERMGAAALEAESVIQEHARAAHQSIAAYRQVLRKRFLRLSSHRASR
ncbi:MAG TPA: peptidoglycan recognition family protein [Candidatus Solibacter sp.]|jgi:hypothetical protein